MTHSAMTQDIPVPSILQCPQLYASLNEANLLWSSGNTSSYLHQDGYANLLTVFEGATPLTHYIPSFFTHILFSVFCGAISVPGVFFHTHTVVSTLRMIWRLLKLI